MADWGLRVSQDGADVLTADDSNMIFTPKRPPLKVIFTGTFSVTIPASATSANFSFVTGVTVKFTAYSFTYADIGDGKMRREPGLYANSNYTGCDTFTDYVSLGGGLFVPRVNIFLGRTSSATSWPNAVTITGRYYVVGS